MKKKGSLRRKNCLIIFFVFLFWFFFPSQTLFYFVPLCFLFLLPTFQKQKWISFYIYFPLFCFSWGEEGEVVTGLISRTWLYLSFLALYNLHFFFCWLFGLKKKAKKEQTIDTWDFWNSFSLSVNIGLKFLSGQQVLDYYDDVGKVCRASWKVVQIAYQTSFRLVDFEKSQLIVSVFFMFFSSFLKLKTNDLENGLKDSAFFSIIQQTNL